MPEVILHRTLTSVVNLLRKDVKDGGDESILYRLLGVDENGNPFKLNSYNFLNQARKIFGDVNNFRVSMGYDPTVASNLALHIILPSEQGEATIGFDEGYVRDKTGDRAQEYFVNSFKCNYQIMITGNNINEVNLAYNVLKSLLIMVYEHLELEGLRNPSFSGNDILMQEDITPVMMFHKVINVSFFYELVVPQMYKNGLMKTFIAEYRAINN